MATPLVRTARLEVEKVQLIFTQSMKKGHRVICDPRPIPTELTLMLAQIRPLRILIININLLALSQCGRLQLNSPARPETVSLFGRLTGEQILPAGIKMRYYGDSVSRFGVKSVSSGLASWC